MWVKQCHYHKPSPTINRWYKAFPVMGGLLLFYPHCIPSKSMNFGYIFPLVRPPTPRTPHPPCALAGWSSACGSWRRSLGPGRGKNMEKPADVDDLEPHCSSFFHTHRLGYIDGIHVAIYSIHGSYGIWSYWLVVYLPFWKIMEFVSWDDDIPNIWKNKIHVPKHQPG